MLKLLTPHLRIESVLELTLDRLRKLGLDSLLLDVDCTLKRYSQNDVEPGVADWIEELSRGGIELCLVSNGLAGRIGRFAEQFDLPFIARACKPFPFRMRAAVRKMGFRPDRTAMVGDQVFADVLAGRLAGLVSILVRPIRPEEEPWYARLKRGPERLVLGARG